jgi:Na+/H+-translocating membrane pyrophosphatase
MILGIIVGPVAVAGLLPGALVSGVQLAISMSNTGGAWDNAKKLIESGRYRNERNEVRAKHSDEHKAAVVGDTVGDPLNNKSKRIPFRNTHGSFFLFIFVFQLTL